MSCQALDRTAEAKVLPQYHQIGSRKMEVAPLNHRQEYEEHKIRRFITKLWKHRMVLGTQSLTN